MFTENTEIIVNRTKSVEGQDVVWEGFWGQSVFQLPLIQLNMEANFLCGQPCWTQFSEAKKHVKKTKETQLSTFSEIFYISYFINNI